LPWPARLAQDASGNDLVRIGSVEGAVRASSLRHVVDLVDKHPEESLAVMRNWMVKEAS
jgi:flagellar M-ring protein FliF